VHTLSLLRTLRPLAHNIYLITGNFPEDAVTDEGFHIINISSKGYYSKKVLEVNKPGTFLQCLWTDIVFCYRLLKLSRKIDTVVFFVAMTFPLTMLVVKLLRKEVIYIVTGSARRSAEKVPMKDLFGIGTFFIPRIVGLLEASYFFLADRIIVEMEETIGWLGIDRYRHKIAIGRFLIDTDFFKIEKPYETRENIVGYIGSFIHSKGIINLARAVPLVLKSRDDIEFMLGGGGPLFNDIESELKQNGLSDKVSLHGWIPHDEVRDYLNQMKLLVMPSYTEGGVQAIALEAMACGTPILTTPVAGITELIEDGKNGFIIDGDSPQLLADKILAALEHPALDKIRENGARMVKEEYSYEAVSKRYQEILYGR
jgi:glycosyltransferase involved in cell wall biosynthesis